MQRDLLKILACPSCRGALWIDGDTGGQDILTGELVCSACHRRFAIRDGVARFAEDDATRSVTQTGFDHQWMTRLTGRHEPPHRCYGFDVARLVRWLLDQFSSSAADSASTPLILDAGCGSGEKTIELARQRPEAQVVGLDLAATLSLSRKRALELRNVHFVQADIHNPPFSANRFHQVFCLGVLHHTANPEQAFRSLTRVVRDRGALTTWLYPEATEDPFWAALYWQRDRWFLGLANRLPPRMLMALCQAHVFFTLLPAYHFANRRAAAERDRYPFLTEALPLAEFYRSAVFLTFDNLAPEFQHRHGRSEVRSWYAAARFDRVDSRFPGFFCGSKRPRS